MAYEYEEEYESEEEDVAGDFKNRLNVIIALCVANIALLVFVLMMVWQLAGV